MSERDDTYYRRGLGLKAHVKPLLEDAYGSALVRAIKAAGYELSVGRFTFRMAHSLGFCYGVDRAVEYAYETCAKFPDRRIFLVGEIIHNPVVNQQLRESGVTFLFPDSEGRFDFETVTEEDVVLIVLHVWKRVEGYARDGYTAVIHGKHFHEETRATSSQVLRHPGGRYLILRDMEEAELLCGFVQGEVSVDVFRERFGHRSSDGFDPELDLQRIGVANQTTMLASESLAIAARLGETMAERYGHDELSRRFRSFDTICSATQDRQDAVQDLMEDPPDLMIVVGGYNSSNTNHLASLCSRATRTFHIEAAKCIDPERGTISHKVPGTQEIREEETWLPAGRIVIGLTAGASTPDSLIGDTTENVLRSDGLDPAEVLVGTGQTTLV
jgi:4-hydroxy-3-methylbut-2-enyl diphosphate reductase